MYTCVVIKSRLLELFDINFEFIFDRNASSLRQQNVKFQSHFIIMKKKRRDKKTFFPKRLRSLTNYDDDDNGQHVTATHLFSFTELVSSIYVVIRYLFIIVQWLWNVNAWMSCSCHKQIQKQTQKYWLTAENETTANGQGKKTNWIAFQVASEKKYIWKANTRKNNMYIWIKMCGI